MIYTLFGILAVVVSVLLILIVLVQNSKGGGLSSTFGASNISSMVGNRRAAQDVEKFTWYLAAGLLVACFMTSSGAPTPEMTGKADFKSKVIAPAAMQNAGAPADAGAVPTEGGDQ